MQNPNQNPIDEFTHDVFLSHSSYDKAVVRSIADQLRADGLKVWFADWEIKPGDSIPARIEEGLEHSRVLVLFMSANAFGSDWAQLEAGTFRFNDPLNKQRRLVPLRLDGSPIKGSLAQLFYINWLSEDRNAAYVKLLEACSPLGKSATAITTTKAGDSEEPKSLPAYGPQSKSIMIGDAWSGLRGVLRQAYSTSIIKLILGKAGLQISKFEYTGTHAEPVLNETDRAVSSMDDDERARFALGCIEEIRAFEQQKNANLSKRGAEPDDHVLQSLQQVLTRFGHNLDFKSAKPFTLY